MSNIFCSIFSSSAMAHSSLLLRLELMLHETVSLCAFLRDSNAFRYFKNKSRRLRYRGAYRTQLCSWQFYISGAKTKAGAGVGASVAVERAKAVDRVVIAATTVEQALLRSVVKVTAVGFA